jgi:hypothetical protein
MTTIKKTWREKRLAREERDDDEDTEPSSENDERQVEVNMVFELPSEFWIPEDEVAELALGAKAAVFQKPERLGVHMKPLFIGGYLQGKPMRKIMVDGGAGVNVMPLMTFNKMGYQESDLMRTNTSLSTFTGEVTETKGVITAELAIGSKILATAFFIVDVGGRYNLLLRRDWIHANGCVPSMLHQCLIQWIGDDVEIVVAKDSVCVATTEAWDEVQNGASACLSGRDLGNYDYISIGKDGFVPVSVKLVNLTWLSDLSLQWWHRNKNSSGSATRQRSTIQEETISEDW